MDFAHCLVVVDGQIIHRTPALRTNDVGTPTVLGKAIGQAAGKGKRGVTPKEVFIATTYAFVVPEGFGRHGIFSIRGAQQKMWQRQPDKSCILGFAKAIPLCELGAFKNGLQIFQIGQIGKAIDPEKLGASGSDKWGVGHGRDGRNRLQQLDILAARIEFVVANDGAKRLAAKLAKFGGIDRFV